MIRRAARWLVEPSVSLGFAVGAFAFVAYVPRPENALLELAVLALGAVAMTVVCNIVRRRLAEPYEPTEAEISVVDRAYWSNHFRPDPMHPENREQWRAALIAAHKARTE